MEYDIAVKAFNNSGSSDYSAPVTIHTMAQPNAPDLTVMGEGDSIVANWTYYDDVDEFVLLYRIDGSSDQYVEVYPGLDTSYIITDLDTYTTYEVAVFAVFNGIEGEWDVEYATTGEPSGAMPGTPTQPKIENFTDVYVDISWAHVSGATLYNLYRSTLPPVEAVAGQLIYSGSSTMFHDANVEPDTIYYYAVTAENDWGSSMLSSEVSVTTPAAPGSPPDTPTNLLVDDWGSGFIDISWDPVTGADYYEVFVSEEPGVGTSDPSYYTEYNSFRIDYLQPGTQYYFRVWAVNSQGSSGMSTEVSQITDGSGNVTPVVE